MKNMVAKLPMILLMLGLLLILTACKAKIDLTASRQDITTGIVAFLVRLREAPRDNSGIAVVS